jgi:hypothetical protein
MSSPYHGHRAPYRLPSNKVLFHDWRYVHTGGLTWETDEGETRPLLSPDPVPSMNYVHHDMPTGISIAAQPAEKSDPVLWPDEEDIWLFGGSLIHVDGMYRLFVECWPEENFSDDRGGHFNIVRYFESDNGVEWWQPPLGMVDHRGSRANNVVYGAPLTGEVGYHGGSVFLDPSAPPAERYKGWHLGNVSHEVRDRFRRDRPNDIDPNVGNTDYCCGLYGATSPDGIAWTHNPEPMVIQHSDTQNVCTWDSVREKYVAYCRMWLYDRRTIGRMESDDFRDFTLPEVVFWPGADMAPHDLWYNNAKTIMPGTVDYHVMFPVRWDLRTDEFTYELATSPDGITWTMVPGGPVNQPGGTGDWDAGVVVPGVGLVDLPGDRTGMLFEGSPIPHKHPRKAPLGKLAWATWKKDRLCALDCPQDGSFALQPLLFDGNTVRLNAETGFAGFIEVEADGPDGLLPGYSFEECDRINGDMLDRTVSWNGKSAIVPSDTPVRLRFRMRDAKLFAVQFA